jgi:hypothetical protein
MANFIKRVILLFALSQVLWLTACDDVEQETPLKTILVLNIPESISISQDGKQKIITESNNNPYIKFRQGADELSVNTEGLYFMALFVPADFAILLSAAISNDLNEARDVIDYGEAIVLAKIHNRTVARHILSLSSNVAGIGYYWDGSSKTGATSHRVCTMLITPDARFVLRVDFTNSPILGSQSEYTLNYGIDMETVFETTNTKLPQDLLPNDAVEYLLDSFS